MTKSTLTLHKFKRERKRPTDKMKKRFRIDPSFGKWLCNGTNLANIRKKVVRPNRPFVCSMFEVEGFFNFIFSGCFAFVCLSYLSVEWQMLVCRCCCCWLEPLGAHMARLIYLYQIANHKFTKCRPSITHQVHRQCPFIVEHKFRITAAPKQYPQHKYSIPLGRFSFPFRLWCLLPY